MRAVAISGDELVVAAPPELRCWLAERFAGALARAACGVLGPRGSVRVGDAAGGATAAVAPVAEQDADPGDSLNPKYSFEQFVIGDANRLAHAAALAVAELPGQAYNPLLLCGPPGVGKTHLLQSIGNYVRAYGGGLTVRYVHVETFTSQFVAALGAGRVDRFKGRFRSNDVLLVDDVQFLASKAKTEEEFFHTFNALYEAGAQLVLTCNRPPRDVHALEERLRERFESGLVAPMQRPDVATRVGVLRKRVQHDAIPLADDQVLWLLAERVSSNVRALEAALIHLVALASLTRRALDVELALELLGQPSADGASADEPAADGASSIEDVQALTAEAFEIGVDELVSRNRRAHVAWARQVAMFLARRELGATLPAIAVAFGGRNHTTVIHACKRTAERVAGDPEAAALVSELTRRARGSRGDRRG